MSDTHQMNLIDTFSDESELWACPECGRKFVLDWNSNKPIDVIERGDGEATHVGGKSGIIMDATIAKQSQDGEYLGPDDEYDQWLKGKK